VPSDFADLGRFTDVSLLILLSLADGQKHGYAMIEDISRFSGTVLEPGTLYGALMRLEKKRWIEPLPAEDRRHPYRLTAVGAMALREQLATLRRLVTTGVERLALG
jgi:DNA-binding PadR family transcriptional regulator